ncbi:ATP-dependent DNA helicase [Saccharothrix violaceirubra]|uniref:DNA 3'-5' helicase n=1 Tax=Saccharothrix violaceirubra TaxID=413306 RepID=A0A7W7T810_9PSEU|nr:ATP-dependent DNA helicase [Saccharothrix violaceirubra]MBB4968293.1 superfamily I DNA/RNA helicase/RecB family exonuclease [Saccharothrix violaceirubra]
MAVDRAPLLVRPAPQERPERHWDTPARAVLDHGSGPVRVLGGPGTGKTTLLAEVVADRVLRRGVHPENVLVLTANRRAAVAMRAELTRLLARPGEAGVLPTTQEPLVRTVHSYAFAVLRARAVLAGEPAPRLLAGPEQDAVVRELLLGDVAMGAENWPDRLRPALTLPGFAAELRDLLSRATERGLAPEDLLELGRVHGRAEWAAAGSFGQQYEQVNLLSGAGQGLAPTYDAAELVGGALLTFETEPDVLDAERRRVRHLLVDDAQHLDPVQYELVRALGTAAREFVLAGDPDQAVFSFRGADPAVLTSFDGPTVVLRRGYRMAPEIRDAVARVAGRLPGVSPTRDVTPVPAVGAVQVRLFASAAQEAAWVADRLRRAHLIDEVPWSGMAVVARSATRSLPVLQRALLAAGVPVSVSADELPLAQQPAVMPFLALLRCAAVPGTLDEDTAAMLLSSALGGADPLALRRLRRGLRRLDLAAGGDRASGELLVEVIESGDRLAALEAAEAVPARRIAGLLRRARKAMADGLSVEQVLWELWQATGLEQRWVAQSARRGTSGMQADRDLDAIVGLFESAAKYVDRLPGASAEGFADYLAAQQFVGDTLAAAAPTGEAVTVLTAHAAAGREWTVVAVPGVQEGSWPDLRLRGSLLGVERMVDVVSGVDAEHVSPVAPLLAEERRLLLVAASRARRTLLVSAVRGEDEQPSRFLDELEELSGEEGERPTFKPERGLVLAELVGELRRVVCSADESADRRGRAATQLARLAAEGVPGAHPDSWYGLGSVTSESPLWTEEHTVSVSPSTVEVLAKCPLRWVVERHGGQDPAELASITGTLVHALAQAAASGADEKQLREQLDEAWAAVDAGAPWFSRRERIRVERMLDTFLTWLASSRAQLTQVAVEEEISVEVPRKEGGPWLRVRGRVDRLETDRDGRPVVVDVKTGKSPVTRKEAEQHPQLAVYQLASALGGFTHLGLATEPGGARLLYVAKENAKTGATELAQKPLDEQGVRVWLEAVQAAAGSSVGPAYQATENPDCSRCPARTTCPLHESGRQVSQ